MWWILLLPLWATYSSAEDIDYHFKSSPFKTLPVHEHTKAQQKVKEFHENWRLQKIVYDHSYEYIFEWNCFCATCLEIPKYIRVSDDKIAAIKFSDKLKYDYYPNENEISPQTQREFTLALPNYGCDDLYLHSKHYHTVEGLYHILQQSLHPSHYDPNRHIVSMTFDSALNYPKSVYISNDLHELGWTIKCLSMGTDGGQPCSNSKAGDVPFWIEQRWQELFGWLMLALVFCMSCVAHFIEYLKKRARKKHRERIRAQVDAQNQAEATIQQQAKKGLSSRKKHGVGRNRKGTPKARGRKRERDADAGDMKVEEEEQKIMASS